MGFQIRKLQNDVCDKMGLKRNFCKCRLSCGSRSEATHRQLLRKAASDFSQILSPDFSPHCCGKMCPEESFRKTLPNPQKCITKIPDTFPQRGQVKKGQKHDSHCGNSLRYPSQTQSAVTYRKRMAMRGHVGVLLWRGIGVGVQAGSDVIRVF